MAGTLGPTHSDDGTVKIRLDQLLRETIVRRLVRLGRFHSVHNGQVLAHVAQPQIVQWLHVGVFQGFGRQRKETEFGRLFAIEGFLFQFGALRMAFLDAFRAVQIGLMVQIYVEVRLVVGMHDAVDDFDQSLDCECDYVQGSN